MELEKRIALIIPCFNESDRLDFLAFKDFLTIDQNIDLIFVNDGSSDQTLNLLKQYFQTQVKVKIIEHSSNLGKAEAIRTGFLHCLSTNQYSYIGFWDADLSTPIKEFITMLDLIKKDSAVHMVIGSRWNRLGANIKRSKFRHYPSRVFATIASLIINMPVYDTQCGAKVFKIDYLKEIVEKKFVSKWFFDIELFLRFKKICTREKNDHWVLEMPVDEWVEMKGSKTKWSDFIIAPYDLLKIIIHYHLKQ